MQEVHQGQVSCLPVKGVDTERVVPDQQSCLLWQPLGHITPTFLQWSRMSTFYSCTLGRCHSLQQPRCVCCGYSRPPPLPHFLLVSFLPLTLSFPRRFFWLPQLICVCQSAFCFSFWPSLNIWMHMLVLLWIPIITIYTYTLVPYRSIGRLSLPGCIELTWSHPYPRGKRHEHHQRARILRALTNGGAIWS